MLLSRWIVINLSIHLALDDDVAVRSINASHCYCIINKLTHLVVVVVFVALFRTESLPSLYIFGSDLISRSTPFSMLNCSRCILAFKRRRIGHDFSIFINLTALMLDIAASL